MSSSAAGGCNGRLPSPSPQRMARSTWPATSYDLGNLRLLEAPPTSEAPEAPALCLPFNRFLNPILGASLEEPLLRLLLIINKGTTVHKKPPTGARS